MLKRTIATFMNDFLMKYFQKVLFSLQKYNVIKDPPNLLTPVPPFLWLSYGQDPLPVNYCYIILALSWHKNDVIFKFKFSVLKQKRASTAVKKWSGCWNLEFERFSNVSEHDFQFVLIHLFEHLLNLKCNNK